MAKDYIKIVCYNQIENWHTRKNALKFFRECARNSEGAERDRYINIVWDLEDRKPICHDGVSLSYNVLERAGIIYKTTAPDGTRDYNNQIWYSKD